MQKKVGTILDENLLKMAKQKALAQHTSLSHLFTEALSKYLQEKPEPSLFYHRGQFWGLKNLKT